MGEYAKTYAFINDLKKQKRKKLKAIEKLESKINDLREEIADIENAIGEANGYLAELDYIDNGDGVGDILRGL